MKNPMTLEEIQEKLERLGGKENGDNGVKFILDLDGASIFVFGQIKNITTEGKTILIEDSSVFISPLEQFGAKGHPPLTMTSVIHPEKVAYIGVAEHELIYEKGFVQLKVGEQPND